MQQTMVALGKFSVYSDHPTWDRPQNLLAQDYLPSPNNGVWNEHPVEPLVTITPNTTYWIGLRFNCDYGSGRKGGMLAGMYSEALMASLGPISDGLMAMGPQMVVPVTVIKMSS